MAVLNYKHLHYFWEVARAGGVARAAERLHLTPQSISGQLKVLEERLGERLFRRVGRNLELTDAGQVALAYAEEIFPRGEELQEALKHGRGQMPRLLHIGVADVVPKAVAFLLLQPVLRFPERTRIICREWRFKDLLAELAVQRIDVVIADAPMPAALSVRAFSHLLGTCGIAFMATPALARQFGPRFPDSLDGAPMLLPGEDAAMRPKLMRWLGTQRIMPRIIGEFDDRALMHEFGQAGCGVFAVPALIVEKIKQRYGVAVLGATDEVVEEFYVISGERRLTDPVTIAIREAGRENVFARPAGPLPARRRAGKGNRKYKRAK